MRGAYGLEALQAAFQSELLGVAGGFRGAIRPGGALDAEARLEIYRHAYRARLVDTLRDIHGHAATYLGDEIFSHAAEEFVAAHPSSHPNLRWYGEEFAAWLATRLPAIPEAAELAALDRALRKAFDGPDADVLALEDLERIPQAAWERVVFVLQPTYSRHRFAYNTLALWQAVDRDEPPPEAAALPSPGDAMIWRRGLQPHFRSLAAFEAAALDLLHAGEEFGAACERLATAFPGEDVPRAAGGALRRWVDEELLAGVRLHGS